MNNKKYFLIMANYNTWMNEKIYNVCAGISDEQRKADMKVFFKSIHGTLNHLLWGDRAWMSRFNGKTYQLTKIGEDLYDQFDVLRQERTKMDEEIKQWVNNLNEEWLLEDLTFDSIAYKKTITIPRSLAVIQLFNHQTHHRGQITTLLSQLGIDYGATDLPVMPGVNEL